LAARSEPRAIVLNDDADLRLRVLSAFDVDSSERSMESEAITVGAEGQRLKIPRGSVNVYERERYRQEEAK
jgi:hypothetical protein